jgi:hypothetical protein
MLKVYKFREMDEIIAFLSGAVFGTDVSFFRQAIVNGSAGYKVAPSLVGLTFKTKSPGPAGTCTFVAGADTAGGRLTPAEIKTQIEAGISGLKVTFFEGRLAIAEATPASGVTVDHTGTSNVALGFDTNADVVGKFFNSPFSGAPPTTPYMVQAYSVNDNMHVVYTWE